MITIPIELLEQVERGNVLLFIGERILHDVAGNVAFDELAALLAARAAIAEAEGLTFPQIAQLYEDEKGRQGLVQVVKDYFEELGNAPQGVHHLIVELADCTVLATTCFDGCLEEAFEQAGRRLHPIIGNVDVAFEEEQQTQLYKLRGSLKRVESLVLTEDDYEPFFEAQASISVVLQGYLARKTILFVGYDLSDPHFKRLYRKITASLDNFARRAYAFGGRLPVHTSHWAKRRQIELIEADVTAFLNSLIAQLAARKTSAPVAAPLAAPAPAEPLPERPYKFLDYYDMKDASIFFGRKQEIQRLCSLIHAHRLVLLFGASGVGKTSLLLAGAVPRLKAAEPPYAAIYVRALEDPALVIRRTLRRTLPDANLPDNESLVDFLAAATDALGQTLVIILEQFEEFFIRLSPQFRAAFISELGAIVDARDVPVKLVFSLREDWLATMSELERRIPELFRNRMRLLPLTRQQARLAITIPVERLGLSYETSLIDQLLADLVDREGTNIMPPQLQLVCSTLYNGLQVNQRVMTLTAYERLGGAKGVLQQYLDDELARLTANERVLARTILEELVTSQGTKAVKSSNELAQVLEVELRELVSVLERLVLARLLRPLKQETGERAYELAHEYLIREIQITPEEEKRKEAKELLQQGVQNWHRYQTLLTEEVLVLIEAQRNRLLLVPDEQELLRLSIVRHERRLERILFTTIGGLIGSAVGGFISSVIEFIFFLNPNTDGTTIVINSLLSMILGGGIALGIGVGNTFAKQRPIIPVFGGIASGMIMGILFAALILSIEQNSNPALFLLTATLIGALYGGSIAVSIAMGKIFRQSQRILVWALLGSFLGGLLGILRHSFFAPFGLGLTVAIGIVDQRFQSKSKETGYANQLELESEKVR